MTGPMKTIGELLHEYDRARAYTEALCRDLTLRWWFGDPTRTRAPSVGTWATRHT
ncbi:hypothetical protein SAMN05661080_04758 [Modestobacter sp. DSM 44400]|nr:hypothetical protein SAMN05661080_04758 [Modestobacter sp. DSM 44400]